jgi:early secretory antigenic target protein ESAT-6
MSDMSYNFAGISSGVAQLHQQQSTIQGLLERGEGVVTALASIWGGSGSEAFQNIQRRWQQNSADLNNSFGQLAQAAQEASDGMQQTDSAIAGTFGG